MNRISSGAASLSGNWEMGKLEGFACVVEAPLLKVPTMDRVNARVSYASKQLGLRGEMAPSQATSILLYL